MHDYYNIKFVDGYFFFINQTKLPLEEEYIKTDNFERIAEAIEKLEIRGAPAIGIAAAFGVALSLKASDGIMQNDESFYKAFERIKKTRPTAVNLFRALDEMKKVYEINREKNNIYSVLIQKSSEIHSEDIMKCNLMASFGFEIFKELSFRLNKLKLRVLTHCNTGKLATGGEGTAFAVIKKCFEEGLIEHIYADETRPLLQGSRLTAFELDKNRIPFSIICDSMAGYLMQKGNIDLVITGADRISSSGNAANKIGTYSLAVLSKYHNIPFFIAAPTTTIDFDIDFIKEIPIEERSSSEINSFRNLKITKSNYPVYNPSFDTIPAELISGIITENGLFTYPYKFSSLDRKL